MKRLVIDTANILFRVASANNRYNSGPNTADMAGLAMHLALNTIKSYYNKVKPQQIALSFEGGKNWRKAHTRDERDVKSVSKRLYKGNRVKDDSMIPYFELIKAFEDLARNHTTLVCLSHENLEGDDCIAAYARKYSAAGDEVVVLSADKDFIQLLQLPNVTLMNPDTAGKDRSLDKEGNKIDPFYFMYEKAFRGDAGDNVLPALPRVFATKLKKAFDARKTGDTFLHSNLMNTTWDFTDPTTAETTTFKVGDLFEENIILMDLVNGQPPDIQQLMIETVEKAEEARGTFSLFQFQKFCGKFGLKKISEEVTNFIPLLSTTGYNASQTIEKSASAQVKKKKLNSLVF